MLFLTNLTNRIADRNYCVYECGKLLLMTTLGDLKNKKWKIIIRLLNKYYGVGSHAGNIIYSDRST